MRTVRVKLRPRDRREKILPYKYKDPITMEVGVQKLVPILAAEDAKQVGADMITEVGIKINSEASSNVDPGLGTNISEVGIKVVSRDNINVVAGCGFNTVDGANSIGSNTVGGANCGSESNSIGGTYSQDNTMKDIGVDDNIVDVTNSGEDNPHCGGRSVGHGTVYSGGEQSNGEGQSVVYSGEDVSNYGVCHMEGKSVVDSPGNNCVKTIENT